MWTSSASWASSPISESLRSRTSRCHGYDVLTFSLLSFPPCSGFSTQSSDVEFIALELERWKRSLNHIPSPREVQEWQMKHGRSMNGSGLWIRPSLFNHSCAPNCTWIVVGDFLLISTTRDVEAGEELCIPYVDIFQTYAEREEAFSRWNMGNGFICACERCQACREDPDLVAIEEEVDAGYAKGLMMTERMMPYKLVLDKAIRAGRR